MGNAVEVFKQYVSKYDLKEKEISLKYEHSINVMHLMGELANKLNLPQEGVEIAKLIGLLHDIGRFDQWKNYKTFSDKDSIDHANYGADYLFKEGHIREFIQDSKYDRIIEKAIRNHSRFEIEEGLSNNELGFAKMIRDIDKIDIYKQIALKYRYEFDANELSSKVLEDFKNNKSISHEDKKTPTDKTVQMLAFLNNIYFKQSFELLRNTKNFDLFLRCVDVKDTALWQGLVDICYDKIGGI